MIRTPNVWSPADQSDLRRAHAQLESSSFAHRLARAAGTPIELGLKLMPAPWHRVIQRSAEAAVWKALRLAVTGLRANANDRPDIRYQLAGMATGAVGGFFGGPGLLVESPLTSLVMLRAIAAVGRSEGECLDEIETRLACIQVFALGGRSQGNDPSDLGYFGLRVAMEGPLQGAAQHIAANGVAGAAGAPPLVEFLSIVSRRFGVVLSQKAASKIVPVIGAAGGALINSLFIQHFQDVARGHFTLRRLERKFGQTVVRARYDELGQPKARQLAYPLPA